MSDLSKNQIDKLGDRLKKGNITDSDIKLLDDYRKTFDTAFENVINFVSSRLGLQTAGRPAKSTSSIIEKLKRESIRLSQIQDIAGCRLITPNRITQNSILESLKKLFPFTSVIDRRNKPSYGYRAVHVIIKIDNKIIEVQIRTTLQHSWAEVSEKLSDKFDPSIKYGGGSQDLQAALLNISNLIDKFEILENNKKSKDLERIIIESKNEIIDNLNKLKNFTK